MKNYILGCIATLAFGWGLPDQVQAQGQTKQTALDVTGGVLLSPAVAIPHCSVGVLDHSAVQSCLFASSIPTLGMLYPLSGTWFIDETGNVGISTTQPTASLEVKGSFSKPLTGLLTIPSNSVSVIGVGSLFNQELECGDVIKIDDEQFVVDVIVDDLCLDVTKPAASDHISTTGVTSGDLFAVTATDDTSAMLVGRDGNVGIGTSTPQSKLDVNGAISGFGVVPIGAIIAWHPTLTGTPSLPNGWLRCDGQTVEDASSDYFGTALPNLNGDGRFLRGGAQSGLLQDHQFETHEHSINNGPEGMATFGHSNAQAGQGGGNAQITLVVGPPNSGNHGDETRPINMSVVWVMRVK